MHVQTPFKTGKFYFSTITTKTGNKLVARTTNVAQLFIKNGGKASCTARGFSYEGWNFNSGNYLFTTDTK